MNGKESAVVLLSGGLDSTVLAAMLAAAYGPENVHALSINYGQRHKREVAASYHVAKAIGITRTFVDLEVLGSALFAGSDSSLVNPGVAVPHGHYQAESMKATVVPNRNMLLLSLATAMAVSRKATYVAYAAHAGDHAIYFDCRPEFRESMATSISLCDENAPMLFTPFIKVTKAQIVTEGVLLGAPLNLTYSCYEGGKVHCGECSTCYERWEAFRLAKVPDPTEYKVNPHDLLDHFKEGPIAGALNSKLPNEREMS